MDKMIEKRNWDMMIEIIEFLQQHEMFEDVFLYTNGHCYASTKTPDSKMCNTRFGSFYDYGERDVHEVSKYVNPETLTMSFDGLLYEDYNGYVNYADSYETIRKIADKYGLYPEQGEAFNLSMYE